MPTLSILMPVYNEERTVAEAVERTLAADIGPDERELVIVDDGSADATPRILRDYESRGDVRVVRHDRNRGKGAALRTALAHASGRWSTVMDGDLEYDAEEIPKLLEPLRDGAAMAVFGSRGFESHSAFSFWYVVGNKGVTMAANVLYDAWLSDIMTCQKALETDLFRALPLREDGFAIEPEITARLLRGGVRIYEVPITYNARTREAGKKLTAVDGLRVLKTLARCRLGPPPDLARWEGSRAPRP